jgi:hypothetical protein
MRKSLFNFLKQQVNFYLTPLFIRKYFRNDDHF